MTKVRQEEAAEEVKVEDETEKGTGIGRGRGRARDRGRAGGGGREGARVEDSKVGRAALAVTKRERLAKRH